MDFLESLKQDPGCLYIYNWGPYIYGLANKPTAYIVIVADLWKIENENFPKEPWGIHIINNEEVTYYFYRMKYWFDKVLLGDIDCWECACLNKKFIIKEHVKLMMTTSPLRLRKEIDKDLSIEPPLSLFDREELISFYWKRIKDCKFANQIIDNHKIINPKEANKDYKLLEEANDIKYVYDILIDVPYKNLKLKTDDMLKRSKIAKVLQKKKNE